MIPDAERSKDFVGRNVDEAERTSRDRGKLNPVRTHLLQQAERANDIRPNEFFWTYDRSIDMAFSGQMDDCTRSVLGQEAPNELSIIDVPAYEVMSPIRADGCEAFQISGICECVEIDDWFTDMFKPINDKVRTDETGPSGNKNH